MKILNLDGLETREETKQEPRNPFTDSSPVSSSSSRTRTTRHGFTEVPQRPTTALLRTVLRTAFLIAAVVVAIAGVRAITDPPQQVVKMMPAKESAFPQGAAQAIAARFTRAYLGMPGEDNDAAVKARAAALSADAAPDAVNTTTAPTGKTTVGTVIPGQVTVQSNDKTGSVEVYAEVSDVTTKTTGSGDKKRTREETSEPRWVRLLVPVGTDARGRVVVTGSPVFAATPAPGKATITGQETPDTDTKATSSTRSTADAFFQALGGGSQASVRAAAAPGANIAPITGVKLDRITTWSVHPGGTKTRAATATVVWKFGNSGATVEQTYRVQLVNTSSGGARDWRVHSIAAQTN